MAFSTAIDRHTWAAQVAAILNSMPAKQANALRLLYFEHLSDHEAAAHMGVSLSNARSAAATGLAHLAEALLKPMSVAF